MDAGRGGAGGPVPLAFRFLLSYVKSIIYLLIMLYNALKILFKLSVWQLCCQSCRFQRQTIYLALTWHDINLILILSLTILLI